MVAAFAVVAAACGGDDSDGDALGGGGDAASCEVGETDGDLVLYNWSEYIDPELVTAFEEEYDVSVTEDFYDSNETMQAKISTGASGYDVIVPSDYMVAILIEDGQVTELDKAAIPNLENLDPDFASGLPFDPDATHTVPYQWGTTGIGVDVQALGGDYAESWDLIFDPDTRAAYAGQISMLNDPRESIGAALKSLGYSVNTTDEGELDEARSLLADTTGDIATYDSDQFEDLLTSGEIVVAHGYSGDFFSAFDEVDDPDRYAYFVPEEGAVRWVDNMAIVADAPHPCTAHTFINFMLDAENGAALTNFNYYGSPNAAAEEFILPEILEDPAIYPTDETVERLEFIADTGEFETNFSDAFNEAKG